MKHYSFIFIYNYNMQNNTGIYFFDNDIYSKKSISMLKRKQPSKSLGVQVKRQQQISNLLHEGFKKTEAIEINDFKNFVNARLPKLPKFSLLRTLNQTKQSSSNISKKLTNNQQSKELTEQYSSEYNQLDKNSNTTMRQSIPNKSIAIQTAIQESYYSINNIPRLQLVPYHELKRYLELRTDRLHRISTNELIQSQLQQIKRATSLRRKKVTLKDIKFYFLPIQHQQFIQIIRAYNYLAVSTNPLGYYKAYIGPGNNSELIKKVLKNRGYWVIVENWQDDVNFVWTQLRNQKFSSNLQIIKQQQMDTIQINQLNTKKSQLVNQFIKKNQYLFLQGVRSLFSETVYHNYINKIIQVYLKNPKKTSHIYKLAQFLQSQRHKFTKITVCNPHFAKIHNHVSEAQFIGNKKDLFFNLKKFYTKIGKNPFHYIPQTIHIEKYNPQLNLKQILPFQLPCLVKPGQNTNRGKGISVHTSYTSIMEELSSEKHQNGQQKTYIIQKYLMPFLYHNRKFDIRIWTLWNGKQAWFYREGYIRTSSKQFTLKSNNRLVHLTNDAVQKYSDDYGKYESGNKLSFNEFQKYLQFHHQNLNFKTIYDSIKQITKDVFRLFYLMTKIHQKFAFELFGLDFMIDQNFKVWLIEVNTNPCLETSCSLLTRLITNLIDNVMMISIDPLFVAPNNWRRKDNWSGMQNFKLQMIYDGFDEKDNNLLK